MYEPDLDVSDKEAASFVRPLIKQGFYPGQLLRVEEQTDKEGKPVDKQYGRQLILSFAVYKGDENYKPTEPLKFTPKEGIDSKPVILAKFVYHKYFDKETKELRTAVTPNSAITHTFQALGWKFDAGQPLKTKDYIGKWALLIVEDYKYKDQKTEKEMKASSIKEVKPYEGAAPDEKLELVTLPDKEGNGNRLTQEQLDAGNKSQAATPATPAKPEEIQAKIDKMKELHKEGHLTEEGLKKATEQLEKELEEAKKVETK